MVRLAYERTGRRVRDVHLEEAATERVPRVARRPVEPVRVLEETVTERMVRFPASWTRAASSPAHPWTPSAAAEISQELREARALRTRDLVPVYSEWATKLVPPAHARTKPLLPEAAQRSLSAAPSPPLPLPRLELITPPVAISATPPPPPDPRPDRRTIRTLAAAGVAVAAGCAASVSLGGLVWLAWALTGR